MLFDHHSLVEAQQNPRGDWHALYTRPRHEKAAARVLENKGFDVFLPLYTTRHQWQDRIKLVTLPLFPSYVFLNGGLERWVPIVSTPGVCDFVRFGGEPAVIAASEIEAIRRLLDSTFCVEPHPFLRSGDWVRVKHGPLEGLEGILTRKKNVSRLVLSVEMLGRSAAVEVDAATVERIPARGAVHASEGFDRLASVPTTGLPSMLAA
jgi:transcription elongation factor/antiterminator RfaH